MGSELWQRLKAVRAFADRRQEDIAKICKVSRGAVAQWESKDPNNRTRPSISQVQAISKETGVPVEWMLNDAADVADVWQVGKVYHQAPTLVAAVPSPISLAPTSSKRLLTAFRNAVEYSVLQLCPDIADGFEAEVGHGPISVRADFVCGRALAVFAMSFDECIDPGTLGRLLLLERAAGKSMLKLMIVSTNSPLQEAERSIIDHLATTFGIKVIPVSNPDEAAECLVSHCSNT